MPCTELSFERLAEDETVEPPDYTAIHGRGASLRAFVNIRGSLANPPETN